MTPEVKRKVVFMKDYSFDYPQLFLDIYVEGDEYEQRNFAPFFALAGCKKALTPEKADLVVFTGGPDVNPILYDEAAHSTTDFDAKRDESDIKLYEYCIMAGVPMLGVCRGAQFLWVMSGGKLYQDVDNHQTGHDIWDLDNKKWVPASSVHHQMVIYDPSLGMEVIATSSRANTRWRNDIQCDLTAKPDVEAYYLPDSCILGIQGHPEYAGYEKFAKWSLEKLYECVVSNPDVTIINGVHRLKESVRDERSARWEEMVDTRMVGGMN